MFKSLAALFALSPAQKMAKAAQQLDAASLEMMYCTVGSWQHQKAASKMYRARMAYDAAHAEFLNLSTQ